MILTNPLLPPDSTYYVDAPLVHLVFLVVFSSFWSTASKWYIIIPPIAVSTFLTDFCWPKKYSFCRVPELPRVDCDSWIDWANIFWKNQPDNLTLIVMLDVVNLGKQGQVRQKASSRLAKYSWFSISNFHLHVAGQNILRLVLRHPYQ